MINLFDLFKEDTLNAEILRKSGHWIPYVKGTYETLSLEERKYYLDLIKLAESQISQSYFEYTGKYDISDSICDFFSDLCRHIKYKGNEIYDRFYITVPELIIPDFINDDFCQCLSYIEYDPSSKGKEWIIDMEYDQSSEILETTNLENLIDDNYINLVIIEALKTELEKQERGIKDAHSFYSPRISNDDIVNYLLELERQE